MTQTRCDKCGQVIDRDIMLGDESIVFVAVATWSIDDAYWSEYHRRCARGLTVAEVWVRPGLVPL